MSKFKETLGGLKQPSERTEIIGKQGGRTDSLLDLAIRLGKVPEGATEEDLWEALRGKDGDPGKDAEAPPAPKDGDLIETIFNSPTDPTKAVFKLASGKEFELILPAGPPGQGVEGKEGPRGKDGESIRGEDGKDGKAGTKVEYRYAQGGSTVVPPTLQSQQRDPAGWSVEVPAEIIGRYVWESYLLVNVATDEMENTWSVPRRVSGLPGTDGLPGKDGKSFDIKGQVATYAELRELTDLQEGDTYLVTSTGKVYTYKLGIFPPEEEGIQFQGNPGPTAAYRGDWSEDKIYMGSPLVVDMVKYDIDGKGYIARTDVGIIPAGTLPTDTAYWNPSDINVDAVFTDFLFAYAAHIDNLTVGVVQTAVPPSTIPSPLLDGERTTLGYMPILDVTSAPNIFSKHGMRQYHPSGRISMYMGPVNGFSYKNEENTTKTVNGWAIITFMDTPESPVFFVLDSTSIAGLQYNIMTSVPNYSPKNLRLTSLPVEFESISNEGFKAYMDSIGATDIRIARTSSTAIGSSGTPYVVISIESTVQCFYKYYTPSSETFPDRYVTASNETAQSISDGWYLDSIVQGFISEPTSNYSLFEAALKKIVGGVEVAMERKQFYAALTGANYVPGQNITSGTLKARLNPLDAGTSFINKAITAVSSFPEKAISLSPVYVNVSW